MFTGSIRYVAFLCLLSSGKLSGFCVEVSFSADILPLLSDRCFQCHGPDEGNREADLRLDQQTIVVGAGEAGGIVVPGDLEKSELWLRIIDDDPSTVMPPPESHREKLTEKELGLIRSWILQGAKWEQHWSFKKIIRPPYDGSIDKAVDHFVDKVMVQKQLQPNPPASPQTQLRRLSFTLRGVGPDPDEVKSFIDQEGGARWSQFVDDYLASSLHAERLAMWWLDAARYSDSDGFQQDLVRENWPWRDWVIRSFQENKRFDQFTIEQFAGDLLENASEEQIIATCFHRNHMTNGEGGRDPAESRVDYVLDRTNTMGTVWLGLTLGCTQCHSHKFDPITQHDYYSLTAFFNSIEEDGKAGKGAKPYQSYVSKTVSERIDKMKVFVADVDQEEKEQRSAALRSYESWLAQKTSANGEQESPWTTPVVLSLNSSEGTEFKLEPKGVIQTTGPIPNQDDYRIEMSIPAGLGRISGWRLEVMPEQGHVKGMFTRNGNGDFILTNVKTLVRQVGNPSEVELENVAALADYQAKKNRETKWDTRYSHIKETLNDDARDGWTTEGAAEVEPHVGVFRLSQPYEFVEGDKLVIILKQRSTLGDANIGRFRISVTDEVGATLDRTDGGSPILDWISLAEGDSEEKVKQQLLEQFLLDQVDYQNAKARLATAKRQLGSLQGQAKARSVMVLKDRKEPRETNVLVRGVWDAKGDAVKPGFLSNIYPGNSADAVNRIDLANWLVSNENPLTARVIVNHLWQLMFGVGLVSTIEDFGLQGERPSHPELLDWLAAELVSSGWDLRHVLRLIANSRAFQRSSNHSAQLAEIDPANRYLARGPRYRLDAWMLRDNALHVAGLLDTQVGGPPVYPYQPIGVWSEITMGRFRYEPSVGAEQYRRTLYAFWRRSSAPTFLFDSAQRRVCEVRTNRTNTPLHALTLMNDQTYLECARVLADQLINKTDFESAANHLSMRVISRVWSLEELNEIREVYEAAADYYETHTADASKYVKVGQQAAVPKENLIKTAAWMTCASLVLNLDEAITLE